MKKFLSFLFAAILLLSGPTARATAEDSYTVRFYSDPALSTLLESQQVSRGQHPTQPASVPASYSDGVYRYAFSGWYWTVDDAVMEFSFTEEDCEIWGDTDLFAGYTQYLADGVRLVVHYADGTAVVTDTTTPLGQLLKQYPDIALVEVEKPAAAADPTPTTAPNPTPTTAPSPTPTTAPSPTPTTAPSPTPTTAPSPTPTVSPSPSPAPSEKPEQSSEEPAPVDQTKEAPTTDALILSEPSEAAAEEEASPATEAEQSGRPSAFAIVGILLALAAAVAALLFARRGKGKAK